MNSQNSYISHNLLVMDYLKYTISLSPDTQDFREILMASLAETGFESFIETGQNVEAYLPAGISSEPKIEEMKQVFPFDISWTKDEIPDQNWNEVWEKNFFKPLVVADKCVIRAPFHTEFPKMGIEIIIEPNMAFGTGNHETTTMMMEYILQSSLVNSNVLDMGCGTGILSILSSKCGAGKITSIDIDKWSYDATIENAQLNNVGNIHAILGDALAIPSEKFDIVLANIHKNIIMNDLPLYLKALKPEGAIIVSGFYDSDMDDVALLANSLGLVLIDKKIKNNWCSASFTISQCRVGRC